MGTLQSKRFDEPDDLVTLPLLVSQVVVLGEVYRSSARPTTSEASRCTRSPASPPWPSPARCSSPPAASLLEGSDLALEDAGEHELRGLPGRRRLLRLAG